MKADTVIFHEWLDKSSKCIDVRNAKEAERAL